MTRYLTLAPVVLFAGVLWLFVWNLHGAVPDQTHSLIDEPVPHLQLPPLAGKKDFGTADLKAGHVTVVNIWASWCTPCRAEAPALAKLSRLKGVAIYGVVYEDRPAAANRFLHDAGNPFSRIDADISGRGAKAWNINGVPETFVIDGSGFVRLRYDGPIVGNALEQIILPAITRARAG